METIAINHNIYKFGLSIIDMTQINGKEISKLSLRELEGYQEEINFWIGTQKGLDDVKAGRILNEKDAYVYLLKKCQEK